MPRGLIVVGVDGSEISRRALRRAVEEARLRHARGRVVHAWWMYPMLAADIEAPHPADDASEAVQTFVAETLGEEHDVEVEAVAVQGRQASAALVDAAQDAELLVVGSRGAGGFSSLLLGSVSQQCAHHAPCPIAIVPRDPAGNPAETILAPKQERGRDGALRQPAGNCLYPCANGHS